MLLIKVVYFAPVSCLRTGYKKGWVEIWESAFLKNSQMLREN